MSNLIELIQSMKGVLEVKPLGNGSMALVIFEAEKQYDNGVYKIQFKETKRIVIAECFCSRWFLFRHSVPMSKDAKFTVIEQINLKP
jgi:hypothetical protein